MLSLIKKIIISFEKLFNNIFNKIIIKIFKVQADNSLEINGRLFVRNNGTIRIGKNVIINSKYSANPIGGQGFTSIFVKKNAELLVGNGTGISNTAICVYKSIIIGENVYIGGGCKIYDTDFHSINFSHRLERPDTHIKVKPVKIEDGAFIGASSIILKGVTIGSKSVIGAGSVVTKSVPAGEIWAGNPARFIKKIEDIY